MSARASDAGAPARSCTADRGVAGRAGGVWPVWLPHANPLHADPAYDCQRHALDYGLPACQSLVGQPLEQLVAEQVLQVVTPAGLELSLRATAECQRERVALDRQWQQRLKRPPRDTARASRQYDAVEPENRLVARTLERKWEEALQAHGPWRRTTPGSSRRNPTT